MANVNNSASLSAAPSSAALSFAPIYQISADATAADIGNHIGLQLCRLHSMLLVLTGSGDPLEDLTDSVLAEYLYACASVVEEIIDLRELVTFGELAKRADTNASA